MTMRTIDGIAVFGDPDDKTLDQMRDVSLKAEYSALMADAHYGYIMPVGGVSAYNNQVSVSGVGFDIGCISAGSLITSVDGYSIAIEDINSNARLACWDGKDIRQIDPLIGIFPKGIRSVINIQLADGRSLRLTPDHRVLTKDGWQEARNIQIDDCVARSSFIGLPYEEYDKDPALIRILGYVSADGHITKDGKRVSIYVYDEDDVEGIVQDIHRLGYRACVYRRVKDGALKPEICIYINSVVFNQYLTDLGSPRGKKDWPDKPMEWLFASPDWVRALYISSFCSAEMAVPGRSSSGWLTTLALKQCGNNQNSILFIQRLFESLGFKTSVAQSGPRYGRDGQRISSVLHILGGSSEQIRFYREIGFCYSRKGRILAAESLSVAYRIEKIRSTRDFAKNYARSLRSDGATSREAVSLVKEKYNVSESFVNHSYYGNRGPSRRLPGDSVNPDTSGEIAWTPVVAIEDSGSSFVYDIVTQDIAESFIANGVVVHNCGNIAIKTNIKREHFYPEFALPDAFSDVANEIATSISFGIGRTNVADDAPVNSKLFMSSVWDALPINQEARDALRERARGQLGTVGGGNHYVDVFVDEDDYFWVGVHFGSRGLGHTIATGFLNLAQGKQWGDKIPEQETLFSLDSDLGQSYWSAMELAGQYAYIGREWVAKTVVVRVLGAEVKKIVHNYHNYAWKEKHFGRDLIVVRKGATPAFPEQMGFIGGSMGDDAYIVRGAISDSAKSMQEQALYSTVHGAGRVMSRSQAKGSRPKLNKETGERIQKKKGVITRQMMSDWVKEKGVIVRGGDVDESPHVYRRLKDVIAAQGPTIEVVYTLRPVIAVMANADNYDPWKD